MKAEEIMSQKKYGVLLLGLCLNHRERFGMNPRQPLKESDCTLQPCRTGCPVKQQPQALTFKEMRE